jgi:hypothetical protein
MDSFKVTLDMIEEGTAVLLVGMKRKIGQHPSLFIACRKQGRRHPGYCNHQGCAGEAAKERVSSLLEKLQKNNKA